jgi:hypothetical protein
VYLFLSLLMGRCGLVSAVLRLLWPDRAARERKKLSKTVTTVMYEFLLWKCRARTSETKTIRVSVPRKNLLEQNLLAAVAVSAGNTVRCVRHLPILLLFAFRLLWPVFRKNFVHYGLARAEAYLEISGPTCGARKKTFFSLDGVCYILRPRLRVY